MSAYRLRGIGASWGRFESLALPSNAVPDRTATERQAQGATVRLHIGLEDVADLEAGLEAGSCGLWPPGEKSGRRAPSGPLKADRAPPPALCTRA